MHFRRDICSSHYIRAVSSPEIQPAWVISTLVAAGTRVSSRVHPVSIYKQLTKKLFLHVQAWPSSCQRAKQRTISHLKCHAFFEHLIPIHINICLSLFLSLSHEIISQWTLTTFSKIHFLRPTIPASPVPLYLWRFPPPFPASAQRGRH